jgi:hypothetical protein
MLALNGTTTSTSFSSWWTTLKTTTANAMPIIVISNDKHETLFGGVDSDGSIDRLVADKFRLAGIGEGRMGV